MPDQIEQFISKDNFKNYSAIKISEIWSLSVQWMINQHRMQ